MAINLKINYLDVFRPLLYILYGIVILIGGRASGKSITTAKFVLQRLLTKKNPRGVLIRDQQVLIKNSILNDIKNIANIYDMKSNGDFSKRYDIQENRIKNLQTNEDAVFTIGIKTTSNEQSAKLKSISNLDFVIIEEAEDIRDEITIRKLFDTLSRFPEAVIFFLLNTPTKDHWIVQKYFNLKPSEYDGYYQLEPKELPNTHIIVSNYKDNNKLSALNVQNFESYIDPKSNNYNPDWYYNQILGLVPDANQGNRIVKRYQIHSYIDQRNQLYTLEHPFIKQQIADEGFYFISFDGGMHTTHSAAVLGYHNSRHRRDILIKEFFNTNPVDDLYYIALLVREYLEQNQIHLSQVSLYGDPAIGVEGDDEKIFGVLNKYINLLDHLKSSENNKLREAYHHRKKRRLAALQREMRLTKTDDKPGVIILKDQCPYLYEGLFGGQYRYKDINIHGNKITSSELEQLPPITDLCDAYSYYILAERPLDIFGEDHKKQLGYYSKQAGTGNL